MWGVAYAPSAARTIEERSRCSRSLARLRGGDDDRAPRAQHRGVPADRSERVDAGLVVEARSGVSRASCVPGCWPSSRCCCLWAQLASGPPSAGGGWRGIRLDPPPDLRQRAERRLYASYAGVTRATPYPVEAVLILGLAGLGLWSWRGRSPMDRVRSHLQPRGAGR